MRYIQVWVRGGAAIFIIYVACVARLGSSLFSFHPFLMSLAFTGLMTEAIFMFSKFGLADGKLHSAKITAHWIVISLTAAAHGLGFAAIYYNKELASKPHYVSWHGCIGLAASTLLWLQLSVGVFAKYPKLLKSIMHVKTVKANHGLFGMVTYTAGMVTISLGLCSIWFQSNTSQLIFYSALCLHILLMFIVCQKLIMKYAWVTS
ncbi:hypothetical protein OTU49_007531 [Cherax quadricarinatus]|uniref:ascorbate ferrireductase (transmembrane) n=1 Tax=Cherax quadricarinatus TaxID=27406 RepID=A0AAW0WI22_CHEQU|nr:transmembrane reductase CYB561D2-like [Cherax quadricarinatus]